jgi:hypothetical protein
MSTDIYRIASPTISLNLEGERHVARTLPKGALVKIESETFNGNKLVEVLFEGRVIMMFTQDLRSRGLKVVDGAPAERPDRRHRGMLDRRPAVY